MISHHFRGFVCSVSEVQSRCKAELEDNNRVRCIFYLTPQRKEKVLSIFFKT